LPLYQTHFGQWSAVRWRYQGIDEADASPERGLDPDTMNYSYSALSPGGSGGFGGVDQHNRCCGNKAWCVKDICGIVCVVMTWLLILFAEFVVMRLILLPSNYTVFSTINMIVFQALAFLAFASHIRTMLSDPVSGLWPDMGGSYSIAPYLCGRQICLMGMIIGKYR